MWCRRVCSCGEIRTAPTSTLCCLLVPCGVSYVCVLMQSRTCCLCMDVCKLDADCGEARSVSHALTQWHFSTQCP